MGRCSLVSGPIIRARESTVVVPLMQLLSRTLSGGYLGIYVALFVYVHAQVNRLMLAARELSYSRRTLQKPKNNTGVSLHRFQEVAISTSLTALTRPAGAARRASSETILGDSPQRSFSDVPQAWVFLNHAVAEGEKRKQRGNLK